jgi:hypothetical protein
MVDTYDTISCKLYPDACTVPHSHIVWAAH